MTTLSPALLFEVKPPTLPFGGFGFSMNRAIFSQVFDRNSIIPTGLPELQRIEALSHPIRINNNPQRQADPARLSRYRIQIPLPPKIDPSVTMMTVEARPPMLQAWDLSSMDWFTTSLLLHAMMVFFVFSCNSRACCVKTFCSIYMLPLKSWSLWLWTLVSLIEFELLGHQLQDWFPLHPFRIL